ncbi:MAG: DUF3562 domain-containing protein [Candidatus Kuenenia sp.]|nr:DUF3562 domain-containing protein [Candidatus Kuenenia hertensis]
MKSLTLTCESEKEEKRHLDSIHLLAEEIKIPEEDVGIYYETVLKRYKGNTTVKDYLPVIVRKEVKEIFLKRKKSKSFYGIVNPLRSEK